VLLERSIMRNRDETLEREPFASTVAALSTGGRSVVFRAVTPFAILALLGAVLFVWGNGLPPRSQAASSSHVLPFDEESNAVNDAIVGTSRQASASRDSSSLAAPSPKVLPVQPPGLEAARRIVSNLSHDPIGDLRVVRTPQTTAIIALHDERSEGTSHLFVVERKGAGGFRLVSRAPLDAGEFRGAQWSSENIDADGDGFDEVLYTGTNPRRAAGRKLVLYVPRTRETYAVRLEVARGARGEKIQRAVWSQSALAPEAEAYRATLQQHLLKTR
jgi:hypothetical protein